MNFSHLPSKIGIISLIALFLIPLSATYAERGCCSRHSGVAGCNYMTNHLKCKDGSDSPSCLCSGSKATKPTRPAKAMKPAPAAIPAAATPAATPAMKTKGCCARHGGVGKCNKSTGYVMCKDGSQSATCTCK